QLELIEKKFGEMFGSSYDGPEGALRRALSSEVEGEYRVKMFAALNNGRNILDDKKKTQAEVVEEKKVEKKSEEEDSPPVPGAKSSPEKETVKTPENSPEVAAVVDGQALYNTLCIKRDVDTFMSMVQELSPEQFTAVAHDVL